MLKNYMMIAFRNLNRQRGYSLINITGLGIGIACFLLIFLHVSDELSYDTYHQHSDRLFRVGKTIHSSGNESHTARSQVPMGPAIESEFPGVRESIRFWRAFEPVIGYQNTNYNQDGIYFADSEAFEAFSFPLIIGEPREVLKQPHSVVLTRTLAEKIYGEENPVGKTLSYSGYPAGEIELTVTGVMENLPSNTQFDFTMLVSLNGVETEQENWGSHKPIWTYLWLNDQADPAQLESSLPNYLDSRYESSSVTASVELEPITSVHLYSVFDGGFKPGGNVQYIYLFIAIGLSILFIASINFTNLSTARSLKRAGEVGVRKTLGASRFDLIRQFLGEALLVSGLAVLLALVLAEVTLPVLNELADKTLILSIWDSLGMLLRLTLLWLLVGLIAGLYPAFIQSRYHPMQTLGSRGGSDVTGDMLKKGLVVFQFGVSIVLIVATLTIFKQVDYIRNLNPGFDKEQVVVIPYSSSEEVLMNRLDQYPGIVGTAVSQRVPVNTINGDGRGVEVTGKEEPIRVESYIINERFLDTYRISVVAGRNLSAELASDSSAFLINETAVGEFGWSSADEAIGQSLVWSGQKSGRIVGVVEDFHMASLHENIEPLVMHTAREFAWWKTFISIRLKPGDVTNSLAYIEENWKELTPEGAYEYFFVDQSLEQLHQSDLRMGSILGYFSVLTIFIACLGLFGLAAYAVERRTKEIGIRKILGATVAQIAGKFGLQFLKLVLIGFIIAVPVALYLVNRWLQEFAYHVDVGIGLFMLAGVTAVLIALVTISGHSIRAAMMNPVESLRSE